MEGQGSICAYASKTAGKEEQGSDRLGLGKADKVMVSHAVQLHYFSFLFFLFPFTYIIYIRYWLNVQ